MNYLLLHMPVSHPSHKKTYIAFWDHRIKMYRTLTLDRSQSLSTSRWQLTLHFKICIWIRMKTYWIPFTVISSIVTPNRRWFWLTSPSTVFIKIISLKPLSMSIPIIFTKWRLWLWTLLSRLFTRNVSNRKTLSLYSLRLKYEKYLN